MKITYDKKTDYMAIRFEKTGETYVDDYVKGIDVVLSEETDKVVGFNLYNTQESIGSFSEVLATQKLAMLIKLYRMRAGLTQSDLHKQSGVSLPTIKKIESGDSETGINTLSKLKRVLPDLDLNVVSQSKVA